MSTDLSDLEYLACAPLCTACVTNTYRLRNGYHLSAAQSGYLWHHNHQQLHFVFLTAAVIAHLAHIAAGAVTVQAHSLDEPLPGQVETLEAGLVQDAAML